MMTPAPWPRWKTRRLGPHKPQTVDEIEHKLDKLVARWLRAHRLGPDPAARDQVWGVVRVSVRAMTTPEKGEEKP